MFIALEYMFAVLRLVFKGLEHKIYGCKDTNNSYEYQIFRCFLLSCYAQTI